MSNFLLKNPECVFIHIPKTGGSTIRLGIWKERYEGPVFGKMPDEWKDKFKFAFVRHPISRLVSAWSDFTQHRGQTHTIEEFLDVVMDESVNYIPPTQNMAEKIRHHTIAQTHPFNTLFEADFIGRHENYIEDLKFILDKMHVVPEHIPNWRETKKVDWKDVVKGKTLMRAVEFFEEDFEKLGYAKP